ncbi:unnamed protein product [Calypogeia fissa]
MLVLRSRASHHSEFKGVDASYVWTGKAGGMSAVPSSQADVFKDKAVSLSDKRFLMRFFKFMTDYAQASSEEQQQQFSADTLVEDLNGPLLTGRNYAATSSCFYPIAQSSFNLLEAMMDCCECCCASLRHQRKRQI